MKSTITAALISLTATLGSTPAATAQSVLIQSCQLPSGVTVVHNGRCDELGRAAAAPDFARPQSRSVDAAPSAPDSASHGIGLTRDAFFALANSTLLAECEKPQSSFACLAKTPDVCRRTMPQAATHCEKTLKGRMPTQLNTKEEIEGWAKQVGVCTGNQFLVMAGPSNLNAGGCRTAAATDNTRDVTSNLVNSLRKARAR